MIWQSVNGSAFTPLTNATLTGGAYSYGYAINAPGTYQFNASFAGNDQLNAVQSTTATDTAAQATGTDYTWYIVGAVVVVAALAGAYFFMRGKK